MFCEMKAAFFRIWTWIAKTTSYNNNNCAKALPAGSESMLLLSSYLEAWSGGWFQFGSSIVQCPMVIRYLPLACLQILWLTLNEFFEHI